MGETGAAYQNGIRRWRSGLSAHGSGKLSLLSSVDRVSILTRNDFDSWCCHHLIRLHLERRILYDKCPDVVAESIRV